MTKFYKISEDELKELYLAKIKCETIEMDKDYDQILDEEETYFEAENEDAKDNGYENWREYHKEIGFAAFLNRLKFNNKIA